MSIAQLTVVTPRSNLAYDNDTVGGLFVHDVWSGNGSRGQRGLWRWEMTGGHVALVGSRWERKGGVAGSWIRNGDFLDLYEVGVKVAFLRWWGGDPVGSGVPKYPLQLGSLLAEHRDSKWVDIWYAVMYVRQPWSIPLRLHL